MITNTNVTPIKSGKAEDVVPVACAFIIAMSATFFTPSESANGTDVPTDGAVKTEARSENNGSKSNAEWKVNMDVQKDSRPQHRAGDINDVSSNDHFLSLRPHFCKEAWVGAHNINQPSFGIQMTSVLLERNSSAIACFV